MEYLWPHHKETEFRGQTLFQVIKPYLRPGDRVLDVACGYSPLAKPLLQAGFHLTGFDNAHEPIIHLKNHFPEGEWHQLSFERANFRGFDVLLLLGLTGLIYSDSRSAQKYNSFLNRMIEGNHPRIVLLDSAKGSMDTGVRNGVFIKPKGWQIVYNNSVNLLKNKRYRNQMSGEYDAKMKEASLRIYCLMECV